MSFLLWNPTLAPAARSFEGGGAGSGGASGSTSDLVVVGERGETAFAAPAEDATV
jgi:hypothetical protein